MHKQTLCGQTAGGLGCGEKGGESGSKKKEKEKRKGGKGQRVKVGGVCLSGCGTVIQPRGVAVVFLIEIQQMWERKVG